MYLVTGATGNVGSDVAEQLLASGEKVRVFTRDAGKVAHWGNRVEVRIGDFGKPDTFFRASEGVNGVFLMNGVTEPGPFKQLVAGLKSQGSPRIVFLSSIAAKAAPESYIGKLHKDKEDAIRDSGLPARFVRPGGFMSNAYQWWAGSIKAEGVVYNPMGTGKFAPIAPEDIAAVSVKLLTGSNFPGEAPELTGGELVSVPEQTNILAEVVGKPLRCVDVPPEAFVQRMIASGLPASVAEGVGKSFQAIRNGEFATVQDTVEKVTGKRPMTFREWARKHAARFA